VLVLVLVLVFIVFVVFVIRLRPPGAQRLRACTS
jgi:hypothetical protein